MRKALKRTGIITGLLLLAVIGGFIVWGETPSRPMPEALSALQPDAQVAVTTERWLAFSPVGLTPDTGLIFYPGGRVDYRAYAPAARQIAAEGYLVVIVRMPLNLAVLNSGAAAGVIEHYPEIQHWVIGGHSLGGAMAASFAKSHLEAVEGLVLWAAYPAASDDLSASGLAAASIYGSLDGLATPDKIDASRPLLPATTAWTRIEGGNHAQFGWYGVQKGDNRALISRQEQQAQTLTATLALLARLQSAPVP